MDDLVTVDYSEETNEVIGSLRKGVTPLCNRLLAQLPGFKIEIQHGKIKLVHLFLASLWTTEVKPDDLATVTYQKLIDVARTTGVEVELRRAA